MPHGKARQVAARPLTMKNPRLVRPMKGRLMNLAVSFLNTEVFNAANTDG
jgi:hypothetical protein